APAAPRTAPAIHTGIPCDKLPTSKTRQAPKAPLSTPVTTADPRSAAPELAPASPPPPRPTPPAPRSLPAPPAKGGVPGSVGSTFVPDRILSVGCSARPGFSNVGYPP